MSLADDLIRGHLGYDGVGGLLEAVNEALMVCCTLALWETHQKVKIHLETDLGNAWREPPKRHERPHAVLHRVLDAHRNLLEALHEGCPVGAHGVGGALGGSTKSQ